MLQHDGSLLDSSVDILQHVLVKVFVSIDSLQIFLELLERNSAVSCGLINMCCVVDTLCKHILLGEKYFSTINMSVNASQHRSLAQTPKPLTFSASLTVHPTNN